jgi:nucleotide-binding universal stress UspA family protein
MISFKNILVAIDFGESSEEALEVAIGLAKQYRSALTLIHTWEVPSYAYGAMEFSAMDMLTPVQEAAREQLDALLTEVRKDVPETKAVLARGVAWQEILAAIERGKPDLVVMGTHGRRGLRHAVLGSVAERIVRLSPAPVLTVRAKAEA